ncbi:MAG TPA: hypothetical protein VJJ72_00325 [Candidatus Paceibacterota bacterium]
MIYGLHPRIRMREKDKKPVFSPVSFFVTAGRIFERAWPLCPDADTRGCSYLCLMDDLTGFVLLHGLIYRAGFIGKARPAKVERYHLLSFEKVDRLRQYPPHLSSFQSAYDPLEQYPGAIRIRSYGKLASLSGLTPGILDEAVVLVSAVKEGVISVEEGGLIAVISRNQFYLQLLDLCQDIRAVA